MLRETEGPLLHTVDIEVRERWTLRRKITNRGWRHLKGLRSGVNVEFENAGFVYAELTPTQADAIRIVADLFAEQDHDVRLVVAESDD